jgi:hypothetical protein
VGQKKHDDKTTNELSEIAWLNRQIGKIDEVLAYFPKLKNKFSRMIFLFLVHMFYTDSSVQQLFNNLNLIIAQNPVSADDALKSKHLTHPFFISRFASKVEFFCIMFQLLLSTMLYPLLWSNVQMF